MVLQTRTNDLIQLVRDSQYLPDDVKTGLLAVEEWPSCSYISLLNYLQNNTFGAYELEKMSGVVLSLHTFISDCKRKDFSQIISFLKNSLQDPDRECGKMMVRLLPDVREALVKNNAPNEAWQALVEFESKLFPYLPKKELEAIVGTQMLPFARLKDFLPEFRKAYLVAEPIYDDGIWCETFLPLLKKNREILGKSLFVDEKELPAAITNWLIDFENFVKQPLENVQSFDLVKYINNSSNSKNLSAEDRKVLMQVLEFYIWLHSPFVTREDAVALGLELDRNAVVSSQLVNSKQDIAQTTDEISNIKLQISNQPQNVNDKTRRNQEPRQRLDINKIVDELELPAGDEVLELESGKKVSTQEDIKSNDVALPKNPLNLKPLPSMTSDRPMAGKVNSVKANVASPEDFAARLEEIKRQVLEKRRQDEANTPKGMDGVKKVVGSSDKDLII